MMMMMMMMMKKIVMTMTMVKVVVVGGHNDDDDGNSVNLDLVVGDRVYVMSRASYTSKLYGESDKVYCTFSGEYINLKKTVCTEESV
nr:hypothetical protein BaRGS_020168 [Batillaria attramentaria]